MNRTAPRALRADRRTLSPNADCSADTHHRLPPLIFYVYILATVQRTLYIGVTNDLRRRVHEHKTGTISGFTRKYRVNRLVHYEVADDAEGAIRREKQLKGWVRRRKSELVEAANPGWEDLSDRLGLAEMVVRAV